MFTERLDSHLESSLQRPSHCSGDTSQAVRWECAAQNEGNMCGNWCLELHNALTIFLSGAYLSMSFEYVGHMQLCV